jgi:MFS family permease
MTNTDTDRHEPLLLDPIVARTLQNTQEEQAAYWHQLSNAQSPLALPYPAKKPGCWRKIKKIVVRNVFQPSGWVCVVLLLYISANMMSVSEVSLMCKAQWGDRCFTIEGYFKTATAIAGCIAAPIAGLLVDWFGPRTSLCISICSSAVPAFVFLMSNSIWALYFANAALPLLGGGVTIILPVCQACIAIMTTASRRSTAFGFIAAGFGIGVLISSKFAAAVINAHPDPVSSCALSPRLGNATLTNDVGPHGSGGHGGHGSGGHEGSTYSESGTIAAYGVQLFVLIVCLLVASSTMPDSSPRFNQKRDESRLRSLREELQKNCIDSRYIRPGGL